MKLRLLRGSLAVGILFSAIAAFSACGKDAPPPPPPPKPANPAPANTNTMTANTNTMATSPDDAAIKKSVEDNLSKESVKGVTVTVKDKVVTLTGTVPAADLPKAVKAANEATPKPSKVENQLVKS
jgi:hypothetical protein